MKSLTDKLPHISGAPFLTDGGLETTLIFHNGLDLPYFAAFPLLNNVVGRETLRNYYRSYIELALKHKVGFILESPTWRANPDWAEKLNIPAWELARINADAIGFMHELREEFESPATAIIISGNIGPRGDGYQPSTTMTAEEAARYHGPQIRTCQSAGADIVSAVTLNYTAEAVGIAAAAAEAGIPSVISFTLETDGRLPSGEALGDAIQTVDAADTTPPVYYMINCVHPSHFESMLPEDEPWLQRIRGLRANASTRSHAELDQSTDLDDGNPAELGLQYRELRRKLPCLQIFGGCCGTDHRHVECISEACLVGQNEPMFA